MVKALRQAYKEAKCRSVSVAHYRRPREPQLAQIPAVLQENKIVTLFMPPHSSYLLQPLDVGCFAPLKKAYGCQAENLMRKYINHTTKIEFLPAFLAAFKAVVTKSNMQGGFRSAGLVPFNPEAVILSLDIKLRTPSLPTAEDCPWELQTPKNTLEFGSR